MMKRIVLFASGSGTNFTALHQSMHNWSVSAKIMALISNNPDCGAVRYAEERGIPVVVINEKRAGGADACHEKMKQALSRVNPHLVVLAGYMKMIPADIIREYENRIMNIHPALLPAFGGKGYYGMNIHQAVIRRGVKFTGVTIHFVDEIYDHGPVIWQEIVPVQPGDTPESLAERVLQVEHRLYPEIVRAFCEDRITWIDEKPWVIGEKFS